MSPLRSKTVYLQDSTTRLAVTETQEGGLDENQSTDWQGSLAKRHRPRVGGPQPGPAERECPSVGCQVSQSGCPVYERIDTPASAAQRGALKRLSADMVTAAELAGEPIQAKLTHAPGNNAPIGGLKVVAENAWFAARPSGTGDASKIYAERSAWGSGLAL